MEKNQFRISGRMTPHQSVATFKSVPSLLDGKSSKRFFFSLSVQRPFDRKKIRNKSPMLAYRVTPTLRECRKRGIQNLLRNKRGEFWQEFRNIRKDAFAEKQ